MNVLKDITFLDMYPKLCKFVLSKGQSYILSSFVEWYFLDLHCTNNGFLVPKKNSEVVSEGEDIFLCVSHDCFRR